LGCLKREIDLKWTLQALYGDLKNNQRISVMARGGKREGAGRPAGSENIDTAQARRASAQRNPNHAR